MDSDEIRLFLAHIAGGKLAGLGTVEQTAPMGDTETSDTDWVYWKQKVRELKVENMCS